MILCSRVSERCPKGNFSLPTSFTKLQQQIKMRKKDTLTDIFTPGFILFPSVQRCQKRKDSLTDIFHVQWDKKMYWTSTNFPAHGTCNCLQEVESTTMLLYTQKIACVKIKGYVKNSNNLARMNAQSAKMELTNIILCHAAIARPHSEGLGIFFPHSIKKIVQFSIESINI